MSTFDLKRVRELANKKLIEDTGIEDIELLSDEEFQMYFLLHNIVEDINEWDFYTTDDVYEKLIRQQPYGDRLYEEFSTDECLEQMKIENDIDGFLEVGGDLWLIK